MPADEEYTYDETFTSIEPVPRALFETDDQIIKDSELISA